MGSFDIRQDAPGLLRSESLNITLKFDRTGPTTGRISWNIPTPAAGCTAETQAYCGIVLTVDTTPTSSTKLPINNTAYTSDPTVDANLHAGDKLGSALVVGAFYQDRTTTFMDVTGLKQNTPYFVSGFPADCEFRYFKEGVHAYSMDFKTEESQIHKDTYGSQVAELNTGHDPVGVQLTDFTGLAPGVDYEFSLQLGLIPRPQNPTTRDQCDPVTPTHTITLQGQNASTYEDLVHEINKQIALLDHPPRGPFPPNTNAYFYNTSTGKLFIWDGYQHVEQPVINNLTAPDIVPDGTYWLDPSTNILKLRSLGSWVVVTVITLNSDPTTPDCGTVWTTGTEAYVWDGNVWCPTGFFSQTDDPSLTIVPPCGSYWYDPENGTLSQWNDALNMWSVTTAIQYHVDPTLLPNGTYWLDETNSVLNMLVLGVWTAQSNVSISENAPQTPAPGKYWYKPSTMELFQRDITNTSWTQLDVIVFPTDPSTINDCDLWWNTNTDLLYEYDGVNNTWTLVNTFYQQDRDPTEPPPINNGDVWYDPISGTVFQWVDVCFKQVQFILWSTDPRTTLTVGTVWYNAAYGTWKSWNGTGWDVFVPITSATDPTALPSGTYWYDTQNSSLQVWNGVVWVAITYSTYPLTPKKGTKWFDDSTDVLKEWDGSAWVAATPKATASLNCAGNLEFTDNNPGSLSFVRLTDITLFQSLAVPYRFLLSTPGSDGVSTEPSYQQLGIGTDGSGDERRKLMNEIRYELGYPVVDVELMPEQLDFCITKALEELRSRTSVAYKNGFFFMGVTSETQRYLLTNKVSGMNKIVSIMGIYRLTSSFLSSAHGAGVYGQIVLQHLYNMGTFDLLSYHLISEYTELMEILFAGRITFTWDEQRRELWIHHRFPFNERMVLIEATIERTEQDIITDRWCRTWIRKYATASARMMLAETRGKYSTFPGAGGGVTLNASDLRTQALADIEACMLDIDNYVVDKPDDYGIGAAGIMLG